MRFVSVRIDEINTKRMLRAAVYYSVPIPPYPSSHRHSDHWEESPAGGYVLTDQGLMMLRREDRHRAGQLRSLPARLDRASLLAPSALPLAPRTSWLTSFSRHRGCIASAPSAKRRCDVPVLAGMLMRILAPARKTV